MAAYRYARRPFWLSIAIAAGLTALLAFLVGAVLRGFAVAWAEEAVWLTGGLFFAFVSWRLIRDYATGETVLAVQPQGYLDRRWRADAVPWDAIRRIEMERLESDYEVAIYLWEGDGLQPDHVSEIGTLDAPAQAIADDIARHAEVTVLN